MIINEFKGNLITNALSGKYDCIVHGCNCQNTMGKGIAKDIRFTWPGVYKSDCKTIKGDLNKLGTYSFIKLKQLLL